MNTKIFTLEYFRERLAHLDALPQYALLGVLSGIVAGVVILIFRLTIEIPLQLWLPENNPENFEALEPYLRFIAPLTGSIVVGLILSYLSKDARKLGVTLVLERLNFHEGHLRLRNTATQFLMGVISLVSGQSAGREGPAIHLGAACNSYLGRRFHLPNNSIRVLVGCGTAAAISASFNTPIAGVIFAMEVVMMEYTITGFTPVILASVSAAVISRMVYGADTAFDVPAMSIQSLWDIPFTILMGIILGALATIFIQITQFCTRFQHYPILPRALLAGIFTGSIAFFIPSIMGIGYDSVNQALLGNLGLGMLCILTLGKLLATAVPVGLGMPYSLIGPVIVLGASAGGALGLIGSTLLPDYSSDVGMYSMLGMGAMMGAVLNAPLAALMALLELTGNPNIILPGMLIIVVANLTTRGVFKQKSIFNTLLAAQDIHLRDAPVLQALSRTGVASLMNKNIISHHRKIPIQAAAELLINKPEWIILLEDRKPISLLPAVDLARFLAEENNSETNQEDKEIDLLTIPARRRDIKRIHRQATLQEALDTLHQYHIEALYVERVHAPMITSVMGIVTRQDIENFYLHK